MRDYLYKAAGLASKFLSASAENLSAPPGSTSSSHIGATSTSRTSNDNETTAGLFNIDERKNIGAMLADTPPSNGDTLVSLGGNSNSQKIEAIQRLIINHSNPKSWIKFNQEYFAQVMKLCTSVTSSVPAPVKVGPSTSASSASSLLKPLGSQIEEMELFEAVHSFLVRYGEREPELCLMVVNSLQKDLNHRNSQIKISALLTITNLPIPELTRFAFLAISKAQSDFNVNVRKTAVLCLLCLGDRKKSDEEGDSDEFNSSDGLVDLVIKALADKSVIVLGAAVYVLHYLCPTRLDILHPHYQRLCDLLLDVEEWCLPIVIHVLTNYARRNFVKGSTDKDFETLLNVSKHLLMHRNSSVVTSVCNMFLNLTDDEERSAQAANSLVHSLVVSGNSPESQFLVISYIYEITKRESKLFLSYILKFLPNTSDPVYLKEKKLSLLTLLLLKSQDDSIPELAIVMSELELFSKNREKRVFLLAIECIGKISLKFPRVAEKAVLHLHKLTQRKDGELVAKAVKVMKRLIIRFAGDQVDRRVKTLIKLSRCLQQENTSPTAIAVILWLVNNFAHEIGLYSLDVLRIAVKSFTSAKFESAGILVKSQILLLSVRTRLLFPETGEKLHEYLWELARYDLDYQVRDLIRLLRNIWLNLATATVESRLALRKVIFVTLPDQFSGSIEQDEEEHDAASVYGSSTWICKSKSHRKPSLKIEDWTLEPTDPSLRTDHQKNQGSTTSTGSASPEHLATGGKAISKADAEAIILKQLQAMSVQNASDSDQAKIETGGGQSSRKNKDVEDLENFLEDEESDDEEDDEEDDDEDDDEEDDDEEEEEEDEDDDEDEEDDDVDNKSNTHVINEPDVGEQLEEFFQSSSKEKKHSTTSIPMDPDLLHNPFNNE